MADDSPITITEKSLRACLRQLERSRSELARSELLGLELVRQRQLATGRRAFDAVESLREVIREALESLRPGAGDPKPTQPEWHSYYALHEQYVRRRAPAVVQSEMALSKTPYHEISSAALQRLAGFLMKSEHAARSAQPERAAAAGERVVGPLPPVPAHDALVARDEELHQVQLRLMAQSAAGRAPVIGLTGLPGVGKTAVLIELAGAPAVREAFPDGVLWGAVGQEPDTEAILRGWAKALGIADDTLAARASTAQRLSLLREAFAHRRALLLLDDVWSADHADVLRIAGKHCGVVFTTRLPEVAAALAGQNVVRLPELDLDDGVKLLAAWAPAVVESVPGEARALVEAVGGLPLAIVIVGRYLRSASHSHQSRRLRQSIDALKLPPVRMNLPGGNGRGEARGRHDESLAAVIALSEAALDPAARQALRAVAAFAPKPNTFSEPAAVAVIGGGTDELDQLVDAGLIESRPGDRYTLHQTIADRSRSWCRRLGNVRAGDVRAWMSGSQGPAGAA